ncbi:MAG: hypothetical protein ACLR2G_10050 [Phascolarctobacterium faecium]
MRLAKLAKAKGIPVVSYISPSAWACSIKPCEERCSDCQ